MVLLHLWGSVSLDTENDKEELENRIKSFLFENDRKFLTDYSKAKKAAKKENYVDEMQTALKEITNSIMSSTPSKDFIALQENGLKQLYASNVTTITETKESKVFKPVTSTDADETTEREIGTTVKDKPKTDRLLNRKKLINLIDDDDFVSTLSGVTFTKYGRDLQNIKKFGKTYSQLFGEEWYDLDTQFDIVKKKETYSISPQRPLSKHAVVVLPTDKNINLEVKAKNKKIRDDGVTNGKFESASGGAYNRGRTETIEISLDIPELKGIKPQNQKHITFKEVDGSNEIEEPTNEEEADEIMGLFYNYQKEHESDIVHLITRTVKRDRQGTVTELGEPRNRWVSDEEYDEIVADAETTITYELLDDYRNDFMWKGKRYQVISFAGSKIKYFQEEELSFNEFFEPVIKQWVEDSDIFTNAKLNLKDSEQVWQHKIELTIKSPPKKLADDGEGLYEHLKDTTISIQYYARKMYEFEFNPYTRGGGAKRINEDLKQHVAGFKLRYNKLERMGLAGE